MDELIEFLELIEQGTAHFVRLLLLGADDWINRAKRLQLMIVWAV
jgi:hypothetical protein